jgi:hypothetical protein
VTFVPAPSKVLRADLILAVKDRGAVDLELGDT